jgi:hypothetical protein
VTLTVDAIRECLEGVIPSLAATCAPDGTPNATYVSQVHYVDATHIALTYQFFSKTRENVLANPRVTLYLVHPVTLARYRIAARYLRTETAGPLFESMKAKLAGIASHTGMAGVFRLLGSDVYQVLEIESVPGRAARVRPGAACSPRCAAAQRSPAAPIFRRGSTRRSRASPPSSPSSTPWCSCSTRRDSGCTRWPAAGTNPPAWDRKSPSGRA